MQAGDGVDQVVEEVGLLGIKFCFELHCFLGNVMVID